MNATTRPEAASPLVVDTRDLGRRAGSTTALQRRVPAPADMGGDVIGVPEGSDLDLDLRLESAVEGIWVSGTARTEAVGACVRCLTEIRLPLTAEIGQLYLYPERAEAAADAGDDAEEVGRVTDGTLVDLEGAVRDALVPLLPFQPRCQEDCPGLCPRCGTRLADEPDHHHEEIDPRWAGLSGLLEERET